MAERVDVLQVAAQVGLVTLGAATGTGLAWPGPPAGAHARVAEGRRGRGPPDVPARVTPA